jgi:hypothetical protein
MFYSPRIFNIDDTFVEFTDFDVSVSVFVTNLEQPIFVFSSEVITVIEDEITFRVHGFPGLFGID